MDQKKKEDMVKFNYELMRQKIPLSNFELNYKNFILF